MTKLLHICPCVHYGCVWGSGGIATHILKLRTRWKKSSGSFCGRFFFSWLDSLCEFSLSLRHTTLCRTPLDGLSSRRRDLCLTSHNIQKRHIHASVGIRTHNPSKRQSGALWIEGLMGRGTCTRFLENRRISFFHVVIWSRILRLSVLNLVTKVTELFRHSEVYNIKSYFGYMIRKSVEFVIKECKLHRIELIT
jgi:hypothetical protein